jgi:nicotinamidase/pyrazinamidase
MSEAPTTALIVADVQNDFCAGGALAVPDGDAVVPVVSALARRFETVVLIQDWHPADHLSFASQHPGRAPFETVEMPYGTQVLWPDHCVMGTPGAALHLRLDVPHAALIQRKGSRRAVDSYSALLEADRATRTGLDGWLAARGIRRVVVCGLALDFCVAWTALDARHFGLGGDGRGGGEPGDRHGRFAGAHPARHGSGRRAAGPFRRGALSGTRRGAYPSRAISRVLSSRTQPGMRKPSIRVQTSTTVSPR